MPLELYGTPSCPFTADLREELEWQGAPFVEFDVEADAQALQRMLQLTGGERMVPVLAVDGRVKQVGVQGRGCYVKVP
ncbi:MAG: hypothetical protein NVS1B14_11190 [Vulcanimicrobiaceae bacterium]